ncbi:MAG: ankyrin repeat domain-containing protein, partial [Myxococcota bacterium]
WIQRSPNYTHIPSGLVFGDDGDLLRTYDKRSIAEEGLEALPYEEQFFDLSRLRLKALRWLWHTTLQWDQVSTCPHDFDATERCFLPYQDGTHVANDDGGEDPNRLDRWGGLPLIRAVVRDDVAAVQKWLAQGANPNSFDLDGQTALIAACDNGNAEILRQLVEHQPDFACFNLKQETPLVLAACSYVPLEQKRTILQLLISKGADLNAPTPDGLSPLIHAIQRGRESSCALLLELGADLNRLYKGWSSIFYTISGNHAELTKQLIEAGANIDQEDEIGRTPLLVAFGESAMEVVETLVEAGANVHSLDTRQQSTLHWSACLGELEWCKKMLRAGVALNAQSVSGHTPLTLALSGNYPECAVFLVRQQANLLLPSGEEQKTALHWLAQRGWTEILCEALATQKLQTIDVPDKNGGHPLAYAASTGHADTVQLLVQRGANPNATFSSNTTALYLASLGGHAEATKALIEAGANVDIKTDDTQETPLHLAVESGSLLCVQYLLDAGAKQELQNKKGATPADLAQNFPEILELLNQKN